MGFGLLDVSLCVLNVMVCSIVGYLDFDFIGLMDEMKELF